MVDGGSIVNVRKNLQSDLHLGLPDIPNPPLALTLNVSEVTVSSCRANILAPSQLLLAAAAVSADPQV